MIDEIGKMGLFSNLIRDLVRDILKADKRLLANVSLKDGWLMGETKQRQDI